MTEEEAATKWCPFSRTFEAEGANRSLDDEGDPIPYVGSFCLGSRCMAWRWYVQRGTGTYQTISVERHGYCGLAGKPNIEDVPPPAWVP